MGVMGSLSLFSQAHSSVTYVITFSCIILAILVPFFDIIWVPMIFFFCIGLGCIERRYLNKTLQKPPQNTAVVITGCSSGFGFRLATRLADQGVYVFAGVRKEEDGEKLRKGTLQPALMHPLILDVTKEQHILPAVTAVDETLPKKELKFLALVNNAGYAEYAPIEVMSTKRVRNMFEVNVFGVITVTQAFLPLLRKYYSKSPINSRIINIGSGAGKVSVPPSGQYAATKYALEALSDSLRIELKPWNISVVLVEPGRFETEFQNKAYKEMVVDGFSALDDEVKNHYEKMIEHTNEISAKRNRPPLQQCVEVIEDALLDTRPLARYLAGSDVQIGIPIIRALNSQESIVDFLLGRSWMSLKK